ncbi:MAG: nucleoside recognition protein [Firmicutes bacterium HGW-Firmicutes-7]|nr:MAG: nucleoside recognition protein [Firmicutes bacterium HGW-Firmicutes-7]
MINYLWAILIVLGVLYGSLTGTLGEVTLGAIEEAKAAVALGVTLIGVVAMWTGLMKIAERAGVIQALTRYMAPVLKFLFPNIPERHLARKHIATNIIANMLGLGWAATPAGLNAMKELQKLNKDKEVASIEMCTFLIINISSVQLISINMIAYRIQFGSDNPTEIIGPALIATIVSTIVGVIFCKFMMKVKTH